MTDEEKIRKILNDVLNELSLQKYVQRELDNIGLQYAFMGEKIDQADKKTWARIMGFNKLYADALVVTIVRLKANGFFA